MKIQFLVVGKTEDKYIQTGLDIYLVRLKHYVPLDFKVIPELKNTNSMSVTQQKQKEGELILKELESSDKVVLLDELGKEYTSVQFSQFIQQQMNSSVKRLVFVVGGSYGFSEEVYKRASIKISLSQMTFSHQMIRLLFLEQLYRAYTIIKGEPYHHQ